MKSVSSYAIQPFAVGKTVVTWTATDVNGNSATATQNVTVIDNQKPTITAPANITVNADAGKCSASNLFLGTPITSDNCGVKTVISNATQPFTVGTTFVTWTATDNGGNVSTATQKVTVIDIQKPIITAPADITVYAQDDYCTTTAYINSGTPVTGDNCAVKSVINNLPTSLPFGVKTITWTVTDASGNTQTATQKITVLESDKPVILNCPQDITVIIPIKGTCVKVSWTAPTLANYCTKILSFTSSNKPGDLFCKDNNKVSYSATDANGNDSECEFKIKLKTQDNKSDNDAQSARIFTSSATAESNRVRIDFTGNGSDVTDYFSVSKLSVHDSQWSVLDTKKPATNFQLSSYTVYDNAPTEGDNYYRTNEVLNNGNIITGEVQKVYFTSLKGLVVFPNPASDYIDVNLKNYQGKDVTIYLYNQLGVVQVVKQVQKVNGQLPEHIDLNNLNGGTYLFRVESKGVKDAVQSVVIQK